MPEVVIDGVRYVPAASVPPLTDAQLLIALRSLVEIQYFPECAHKHRAWAWNALNALAPDLAKLAADSPSEAYAFIETESNKAVLR